MMDNTNPISERIDTLRKEIRHHDRLYYVEATPEISDRDYDTLMGELKAIEESHPELITADSPTQRVAGEPIEGFAKVAHALPMLSIDNTYDAAALRAFDQQVHRAIEGQTIRYQVDPKIDGVAATLRYEGGLLVLAATRGDGKTGDDVTANVRTIASVPLSLTGEGYPDVLEVRGEIYWPRPAFNAFNATLIEAGAEPLANPRNGTAGSLKQLDAKEVVVRGLAFFAHGLGECSESPSESASAIMARVADWGVPVNPGWACESIDAVLEVVDEWDHLRGQAEYDTDGMVVKVDDLTQRGQLGATSKYPRWCIAYKYAAEQAQTVLESVTFEVGRTGVVTPVAHFEPVQLAGTMVSNASLHNFDQVARLGLHEFDRITVEKAGEIIPQVVGVDVASRAPDARPIEAPATCPCERQALLRWRPIPEGYQAYQCQNPDCTEYLKRILRKKQAVCAKCDQPMTQVDHMTELMCEEAECPEKLKTGIAFFAGRNQMNIDGLGPEVVEKLIAAGLVHHMADLYRLDGGAVADLEGMGEVSAEKLLAGIAGSKDRGFATVLRSLGIRLVGERTAEDIARRFAGIDDMSGATIAELTAIDEIGPAVAASLCEYLDSDAGREMIERLKTAGVRMSTSASPGALFDMSVSDGPLVGKTVVVTGTLETLGRKEAQEAIRCSGGKATSSVSAKTDFVVAGEKAGSKVDKARDLEVEVIDESEFRRRLGLD
jgi:DNA ligase (NAD+)